MAGQELLITGTGMGALSGSIAPVSVSQVDRDHAGAASGLLKTSQQLGGALGIALVGSVYFAWGKWAGTPPSIGAALVIGSLLLISIVFAATLPDRLFDQPAKA